ncbi:MAG TPA: YbjN domain-containing protein [Friedmanniella sp.]
MTAVEVVQETLEGLGLPWERQGDTFTVSLPGEHKLTTECALEVGAHSVQLRAFVARAPEQDADRVHRWLLERNLRLGGVAFGVDHLGDVYLLGRLPVVGLVADSVDQLLGVVAETADASFDPLVAMGFADSIRREWVWRRSRGESTANLAAFTALDPDAPNAPNAPNAPDAPRAPNAP